MDLKVKIKAKGVDAKRLEPVLKGLHTALGKKHGS